MPQYDKSLKDALPEMIADARQQAAYMAEALAEGKHMTEAGVNQMVILDDEAEMTVEVAWKEVPDIWEMYHRHDWAPGIRAFTDGEGRYEWCLYCFAEREAPRPPPST